MHYNKAWRGIEKVWKWMLGKFDLLQILKTFPFIQAWVRTYRQNDNKSFVYQTLICFLFLISWWTDHHNKTQFFSPQAKHGQCGALRREQCPQLSKQQLLLPRSLMSGAIFASSSICLTILIFFPLFFDKSTFGEFDENLLMLLL